MTELTAEAAELTRIREYQRKKQREYYQRSKEAHKQRVARSRAKSPDAGEAHDAVSSAIREGRITRPTTCQRCGRTPAARANAKSPANVEAHHHRGYAPEDHLNVRWLCKPCHAIEDRLPGAHGG